MLKALRHRLEYAAVLAVRWLVGLVPRRLALAGGQAIGLLFYYLDASHRRLAIANLSAAFPTRTAEEIAAIARGVFAHFGRLLVELLRFSRLSVEDMAREFEFEGLDRAEEACRLGKGALFITGHFGFWELQALAHGVAVRPIAVVARPLDNPHLHAMLERVRTCTGNSIIYRRGSVRRILRALGANEGVAILIDQHIQTDTVTVDFFGRPAATTRTVAALGLRTGAPVIPVFALPLPDGRYKMIYEHPVEPPVESDDPIREFTQRCTDVLEMYVRRHPHLWLWMHRRWRDVEPQARDMFPAGKVEKDAEP